MDTPGVAETESRFTSPPARTVMKPREVLLKFTFALIYVVPAYATSETAAEQEKPAPTVSGRLGRARPDDSVWLVSTRHLGYPPR
jgi:hypothetical protein